jgi:hypothetical protein
MILGLLVDGKRVAPREQDEHVQGSRARNACRSGDEIDICGFTAGVGLFDNGAMCTDEPEISVKLAAFGKF